MILAIGPNNIVGLKDKMPWYSKKDFWHFKQTTLNKPVIFGKTTFFGLPKYPLKNRLNIVLDSDLQTDYICKDGYIVTNSLKNAFNLCKAYDKCYICGGISLFKYCLNEGIVDNVIITKVESTALSNDDKSNPQKYIKFENFAEILKNKYVFSKKINYTTNTEYNEIEEDSNNDILVNYYEYLKK